MLISKFKFSKILRSVLLRNMHMCSLDRSFDLAQESFNAMNMDTLMSILSHGFLAVLFLVNSSVCRPFICSNRGPFSILASMCG